MSKYLCTPERNIQIVLSLLKAHGVKKVIASPGSTDVAIIASMQYDPWFEMYSCIDERSAAYMACGMAAQSGEAVVLTCTGATSSRNYMPGLTEAYYRHLPVLAITCSRSASMVGQNIDQQTDRSNPPSDVVNISVYVQTIHSHDDEWDCTIKVNKAISGLFRNGGGPCHINLATIYDTNFTKDDIAPVRVINRYLIGDYLPEIFTKKLAIFIGSHKKFDNRLTNAIEHFCEVNNAVVFCDLTSNYKGKYSVNVSLLMDQLTSKVAKLADIKIDLAIHIGDISSTKFMAANIWRVHSDGEIRDTFSHLTKVFEMSELEFFEYYGKGVQCETKTYIYYKHIYEELYNSIPELPFSNMWIAQFMSKKLLDNMVLHLGIRNSLRSWNYCKVPKSVSVYSNTGGFGIDGMLSSLIGGSLVDTKKIHIGVLGDLAFFYDMNSLGNREIKPNVRILVINNGLGQEFKNYDCFGSQFGEETNKFIAAAGHYGNHSKIVIKNYVESLGYEYISADNKETFKQQSERFLSSKLLDKPMIFEVFTNTQEETKAYELMTSLSKESKLLKSTKKFLDNTGLQNIARTITKKMK